MASKRQPTRTVFLGDIPYDFSEADVHELVSQNAPGRALDVRLVWDREKNRHKGYGFVEYETIDDGIRAREALNGFAIKGRTLRADYSADQKGSAGSGRRQQPQYSQPQNNNYQHQSNYQQQQSSAQQPHVYNQQQNSSPESQLPANLVANDVISRTLASYHPMKLLEALEGMKQLQQQDGQKAYEVLRQNPQLTFALVQSMLLMGLVDNSVVQAAVGGAAPMPQHQAPVPAQNSQSAREHALSQAPPEQREMIRQVLELSDDQIASLPSEQRDAIIALRKQYS